MANPKIAIIVSSTRPTRFADIPTAWIKAKAEARGDVDVEVVDLRDYVMPFFAEVASNAYPDETQFDKKSKYFDAKSTREEPRWMHVDVKLVKKTRLLSLDEMRATPALAAMRTLQRGNRLSITPVTAAEWKAVLALLG